MSGSDAHIVRYHDGDIERMQTPGFGKHTVFGIWAASPEDVYAVGSVAGRNGFIWHYDGSAWRDLPLPEAIPLNANRDTPPFFKAWGNGPEEVIIVGQGGTLLRGNAEDGLRSSTHQTTRHSSRSTMLTGVSMPSVATPRCPLDNARWWGSRRNTYQCRTYTRYMGDRYGRRLGHRRTRSTLSKSWRWAIRARRYGYRQRRRVPSCHLGRP